MFSGIVEETGVVKALQRKTNLSVLKIHAKKVLPGTGEGDSISVNGVCLTVTKREKNVLTFDIMLETLKKTSLGALKSGMKVNLERALKMSSRISGHFVSGHVDDMGSIKKIVKSENYVELQISFAREHGKYIVPKGSIAVDGVSLTVGDVRKTYFSVYLIPYTLEVTNLGVKRKGSKINLETDILAKYIYKQQNEGYVSPYSMKK